MLILFDGQQFNALAGNLRIGRGNKRYIRLFQRLPNLQVSARVYRLREFPIEG